jgi:hypothetical protein
MMFLKPFCIKVDQYNSLHEEYVGYFLILAYDTRGAIEKVLQHKRIKELEKEHGCTMTIDSVDFHSFKEENWQVDDVYELYYDTNN